MAHKRGDYSDFIIGEIYPDTLIRIESEPFIIIDNSGKRRPSIKYSCTACNSGIIYDGRIDRIRSGRTCRCPECGRHSKRPEGYTKDTWNYKRKEANEINPNNLTGKHLGEIRGDWFINAVDYTDDKSHGHTYYKVINIKTGQVKSTRLDYLPHEVDKTLTNASIIAKNIVEINKANGRSSGEIATEQWLNNHNIQFDTEYIFDELKGINDGYLRFDFKIRDKPILIEFQGIQHYQPVDFFGGEEQFKIQKIHDELKRNYCKANNYKLIEIPYNYDTLDKYLTII